MSNANLFRTLYPHEIDVRVQQVASIGGKIQAVLLLYKNARVDMDLLDEHFGCLGWQREHNFKEGKNYCRVSVYDKAHNIWVSKEDVGTESNTEETKGEASDAFKRACVNLGIGRELYSAPQILVELKDKEYYEDGVTKNGKTKYRANTWLKFHVSAVTYNAERSIIGLSIADNKDIIRYTLGAPQNATLQQAPPQQALPQRKKLTLNDLMVEGTSEKLCQWINKNGNGQKIANILNQFYDCDAEVIDCITNEYLRLYANK
jgi:hypothetical protein